MYQIKFLLFILPIRIQIENPIFTQPNGLNWLTFISTLLLATTAAINLFNVHISYKNRQDSLELQKEKRNLQKEERKLKQEEIKFQKLILMSELQKQYYYLIFKLQDQVRKGKLKPSDYYRRYWIERAYEFLLFRNGFIEPNIYIQWIKCEKGDYQQNEKLYDATYKQGYKEAKNFLDKRTTEDANSRKFFKFMDQVFDDDTKSIQDLLESLE